MYSTHTNTIDSARNQMFKVPQPKKYVKRTTMNDCALYNWIKTTQTEWKIMHTIKIIAIVLFGIVVLFCLFVGQILVCSIVWCSVHILFCFLSLSSSLWRWFTLFFGSANVISIASISLQFMIILLHGIQHNCVGQINKRSRSYCTRETEK